MALIGGSLLALRASTLRLFTSAISLSSREESTPSMKSGECVMAQRPIIVSEATSVILLLRYSSWTQRLPKGSMSQSA
jgi:hypothetical protein